jgi:hypothetical protein
MISDQDPVERCKYSKSTATKVEIQCQLEDFLKLLAKALQRLLYQLIFDFANLAPEKARN